MSQTDPKRRASDNDKQSAQLDERLRALRQRLDAQGDDPQEAARAERDRSAKSGIAQAWRLSSEFVAGVLVGAGLGWGIDYLLGTGPWGLIIFFLLGFAAAIVNVMRASGQMAPSQLRIHRGGGDQTNE